jgi:hypothetical protein
MGVADRMLHTSVGRTRTDLHDRWVSTGLIGSANACLSRPTGEIEQSSARV